VPPYRAHRVSSLPPWTCCFQPPFAVFLAAPAPGHLRFRVHPLVSLASSSEYFTADTRPPPASGKRLPWGSPSPSRHPQEESTCDRLPAPAYVPPSAFLTPSTACSSSCVAGLFHPAATSEIRPSGVLPTSQPSRLVADACPLVVGTVRLPPSCLGSASLGTSPSGLCSDR
jgi:hypothetical protein